TAPTGSGKTVILELAIIAMLVDPHGENAKAVYMAPTKALCTEKASEWKEKFGPFGITCNMLTGDTENANLAEVKRSNIIVTTPEKWDSTTRRWKDNRQLMGLVRLLLVDEVHVLKESRGATMEVVVARMKTVNRQLRERRSACQTNARSPQSQLRIVAVSATVPNVEDIGEWLCDADTHQRATFCNSRKSAVAAADRLAADSRALGLDGLTLAPARLDRLARIKSSITDGKLAGMAFADRRAIEQAFLDGVVMVICTTTTLAVGVNLPAYLVVIKGTSQYRNGKFEEYSELDLLQMIGRAGRPQFDSSGRALILTTNENRQRYEAMVQGSETIESSLHLHLIEHLNAEVVLGTIESRQGALDW
ncbi:P-loop containing nucleoside triphosphate hydrolase protein, partial [Polychytrium aggregatum]|uniref:P-loop containing nucleoside triphosphate hydrolase protein n=1 Tax=Polychytrium aggregatum TaxID=110093 RepID=UPI0022FDF03B